LSIGRTSGGLSKGWVWLLTLAVACGGSGAGGPLDSGMPGPGSGGPPVDAGQDGDAGAPHDAGPDAGPVPDAGVPPDGGGGTSNGTRIQLPPPGHQYHGVFPAGTTQPDADISMKAADDYVDAVGHPLAWIYFSNEWYVSKQFPRVTAEAIRARGAVPFIRLHMRSQNRQLIPDPRYTLDRINAGEFDGELRAWADGAKAFGTAIIVQYGTEVNGDWNPWSAPYNGGYPAGPAKFQEAFRHIVEVMRDQGANNITWALHLNGENWPSDTPLNNAGAYYPGDDVVDWVGFSMYQNQGPDLTNCRDIDALLKAREAELGDVARRKPLFFFELGTNLVATTCKPLEWTQKTLEDLLDGRWPEVHGFSWWSETFTDGSSVMNVPYTPELRAVFHDVLTGPLGPQLQDRPIVQ
jgi:Glycosyl hydrolase family 26